MTITITINTDNAAFDGGPETEVARILRDLARKLSDGLANVPIGPFKLRDSNGNTVGKVEIED